MKRRLSLPDRLPSSLKALAGLVLVMLAVPATADEHNTFDLVLGHYEAVHRSLTLDSTEHVAGGGRQIAGLLAALEADFTAERAGIDPEAVDSVRSLMPELKRAASDLAAAGDLAGARDAFYALSKPLVRWRKAAGGERPVVAYCAMTRRSWLQPQGDAIANPYHGQSMLRCGEVVDR